MLGSMMMILERQSFSGVNNDVFDLIVAFLLYGPVSTPRSAIYFPDNVHIHRFHISIPAHKLKNPHTKFRIEWLFLIWEFFPRKSLELAFLRV